MRRVTLSLALVLLAAAQLPADEIGFIEDFALAEDRTVPLEQLIPGTEDYYYYHCLHYQNNEQFDKVDELLRSWIKRHGYTQRVNEIRYRQALLTYERNPQQSLELIRHELKLQFNHQRQTPGFKPNLPTRLDQRLISRQQLMRRALARYKNLQGFEDSALDWLTGVELNPDQRRHLIQRLARPDYQNLPQLVVADLNYRYSRGFGSMGIHRQLLRDQLDELLRLKPDLLNQTHFVNTYLTRLWPADDVDWRHDAKARQAYLDRLWQLVSRLAPVHNSLKAHVLYHRLVHDRALGVYDKERFMTYIALPRNVSYINRQFMLRETSRRWPANLHADFSAQTMLPPVGNDEPLVRSYLHHFFLKENSYKPYAEYINDLYLKHNFAEAKITAGLGEPEQWYSLLPPEQYQALKQRIDLDFAYTNKVVFGPDDPVNLDLYVKNVKSLIVKIYRINTGNYYRQNLREIDTDINLDGLVANHELTFHYDEPPLRRVRRHFEFPQLAERGVYVIDFIGNGKSSRAVVRKGRLRYLVRTSTAGQVFTVLDEQNRRLPDATLWLAGHEYKPDEEGLITVPFSTKPGRQPIVLTHGDFSSLDYFEHEAENYRLAAGMYVDRQSLLSRRKAQVLIRPALYLNGVPVTLSVLEDVKLLVTSTDQDGVSTTKEVPDFKLLEDRESVFEFSTPKRLARITFTLQAKVQNLSQNKKIDLTTSQTFALNEIDRSDKVEDLHLAQIDGQYVLEVRGKSGEPRPDRQVNFSIKHRDFRDPVAVSLQTDERGRIQLGPLTDIASITATGPEGTSHSWPLRSDGHSYYRSVHGRVGDVIEIPYMGTSDKPSRDELSLLELRGGVFVADRFDALRVKDGMLQIVGLPRGDYDLLLKRSGTRIRVRVSEGEVRDGYVLSDTRQLEVRGSHPLQIGTVDVQEDSLVVQLKNATPLARVHVFATRFEPPFPPLEHLGRITDSEPALTTIPKAESLYVAGRNIGDEYRYIIDRRYAKKYPGNMLERPSLLLNPWAIRKTETGRQQAAAGEQFGGVGAGRPSQQKRGRSRVVPPATPHDFANLDFLREPSVVLANLEPDKQGRVIIDRQLLGTNQQIHVVACDPIQTAYRRLSLADQPTELNDLRLANGLDPEGHFAQRKQISVLKEGDQFVLPDITTSRFEVYDSLAHVWRLYATLSKDPKLAEFNFILNWHKLTSADKRAKYSKYACHELNFFIHEKDPEFFNSVVKPYLRHKKDKTFMDHWLLEDDLRQYLQPWNYEQLNIVERILLGQRIRREAPYAARHVQDLFDLVPPDVDRFNFLFDTALQGSALETRGRFGVEEAKKAELLRERGPQLRQLQADGRKAGGLAGGGFGKPEADEAQLAMPADQAAPMASNALSATQAPRGRPMKEGADAEEEMTARAKGRARRQLAEKDKAALDYFQRDANRRAAVRKLYQKLDKTQEWVENNYYKLPIEEQNAELVTVNAFWNDFAQHDPAQPFYSASLAEASRNFTEMMLALSVLDLPPESPEHKSQFDGTKMTLVAGGPMVVYHQQILPVQKQPEAPPILVSQNFFRHKDRYRYENNERLDKFVTDEFVVHTVYGCQVVVTNPTSSPRKLDVLLQVPVGAIPVMNGHYTRTVPVRLEPYHTQTLEYYFYFPAAGDYPHYPVHVAQNEQLVAFGEPFTFHVVQEPTRIDRQSWAYISQHGSSEDVLAFLEKNNLQRINLDLIAFRMQDKRFFEKVIDLLARRHVYNHTLWSYSIKHNVVPAIRQYLQHADQFVRRCGSWLDSPLLKIDPVLRKTYQHMDYRPLVNARAHQLGPRRQILNDRLAAQYNRLLRILSYHRKLDDDDLMAVTYYMLLQDRVEEAMKFFRRVNPRQLATRLQYDYFAAYLAMYLEDTSQARQIAQRYAEYPVDRWRKAFVAVLGQLDEIEGAEPQVVDRESRTEVQTQLAATEPSLDFKVEAGQVKLNYQNLKRVQVNYYLMDIELLFSRNPFVQQYSGQFSFIEPNSSQQIELPADQRSITFELPAELRNRNVLVEITGGGQTRTQTYYSNSLTLQLTPSYGQLRVTDAESGQPIPKTYVKVYARMKDGAVRFYKDGYTDLRGRFDYASLSTNELDFVDRFSLLVLSDTHGAAVREAAPPKR